MFIAVLIQQFNPLLPFETTNYRAIVENSRLLLDELYKKVAVLQDQSEIKSYNDLLLHNSQTAKIKKCNILENIEMPSLPQGKLALKERPNHIYTGGKPSFLSNANSKTSQAPSLIYEIKFLWERCKLMKDQFESLVTSLDQKEIEQLRYYAMYDKNAIINQVIKLLTLYLAIDRNHLMTDYKF